MTIRIACISGYFGIGGMERTFLTLAENLDPQEYEFHFINLANNHFQQRFHEAGSCFFSIDYREVIFYLKDHKIQIVLTCNCDEGSYLGYLAGVHAIIERPDGYSMAFYTDKTPVQAIVASTDKVYEQAKSDYPQKYTTLIYNGVDLQRFSRRTTPNTLANEIGIDRGAVVIGYCGRIARTKCLDKLLDVYASISHHFQDSILVIAGNEFPHNCGYRDELISQALSLGIPDRVVIRHATEHPETLYAACDIAVLCSGSYRLPDGSREVEGIPNAIMEAMAMELPVVVTDSGETNLLVRDRINGFVVGINDWQGFADRLQELIRNADLRKRMGKEGRAIVEQSFNATAMLSAYEHVLRYAVTDTFINTYPNAQSEMETHFLSHPFTWPDHSQHRPNVLVIRSGNEHLCRFVFESLRKLPFDVTTYAVCTANNQDAMREFEDQIEKLFIYEHCDGYNADSMEAIVEVCNSLSVDYLICMYNDLLGKQYDNVHMLVDRLNAPTKLVVNKLYRFFLYTGQAVSASRAAR